MAFPAPHFDPDMFVSYSHDSRTPAVSPPKAWAHSLIRRIDAQMLALDRTNAWQTRADAALWPGFPRDEREMRTSQSEAALSADLIGRVDADADPRCAPTAESEADFAKRETPAK